jgi:toxin CptA
MSIAVSAVIRPSRQLRWLHALLCVFVLAGAGAFRQPVPRCVMVAAVFASACRRRRSVNGVRLDISGVGGLRVAVYQTEAQLEARMQAQMEAHTGAQSAAPLQAPAEARKHTGAGPPAQAADGPGAGSVDAGREVWLMPGSTLWPALLLLRLRSGDGTAFWLPVLPDTVAPDVLRRVALAMRAIAALGPPAA